MARWSLLLLAFVVVGDFISVLLARPVLPEFMHRTYETAGFLPLLLLAVLVAAPVAEEVLFRGFMFEGLARSSAGPLGAILLSAGLWAAIHLQYDLFGIGQIFLGGILLGWARWQTGSLYACIILHGLLNLFATLQLLVLRNFSG